MCVSCALGKENKRYPQVSEYGPELMVCYHHLPLGAQDLALPGAQGNQCEMMSHSIR